MARRVHQLAKELGVKSTAIVAKCQAEGLSIKNHMSTLSAGLEATIREWFTEGGESLTVETTESVDLAKVRTKKTRKRKKKSDSEEVSTTEGEVAVAELPTAATVAEEVSEPVEVEAAVAKVGQEVDGFVAETAVEEAPAAKVKSKMKVKAKAKSKLSKPKRKSPKDLAEVEDGGIAAAEEAAGEAAPASGASKSVAEVTGAEELQAEKGAREAAAEVGDEEEQKPEQPRMAPGFSHPSIKRKVKKIGKVDHVPEPAKLSGPQVVRVERPDVLPEYIGRGTPRPPRKDKATGEKTSDKDLQNFGSVSVGKGKKGSRHASLDDMEKPIRSVGKRSKSRTGRRGRGSEAGDLQIGTAHQRGDRDLQERQARLAAAGAGKLASRARRMAKDEERSTSQGSTRQVVRIEKATVKEPITVKDLSGAIGVRAAEIMSKLMQMGVMATVNQIIDTEAAEAVALELGVELTVEAKVLLLDQLREEVDKEVVEEQLQARPPVVAFLGHVDHGKTSLLDQIRKSSVASGEAGGITQHIGSYLYDDGERRVAFLDTPGHKAFTAMRARGANMTDIVVLVVAADDGVMPQTEEAISHAKAAGVPIVVALNKIDLPDVDVNRVFGQLAEHDLVPTEWGGDTEVVKTSATTGEGISDLIEHLDYVAELRQLKAPVECSATGWVVESEMAIGRGVVARLLVKQGTLKTGDIIVSGSSHGRVRSMTGSNNQSMKQAGPATPVEITGLDEVPVSGDRFFVVESIPRAAEIADEQRSTQREKILARRRLVTLENLFTEIAAGEIRELNVIVKADVQGSVDVLCKSITEMNTSEVAVRILHSAVGGISESDVLLAEASNAIIIGFQVVADEHARSLADAKGVQIRHYRVIYNISDDIKQALEGMLKPRIEEKQLGRVEIRQVFKISRLGSIAGCYVTEGVIQRSSKMRLVREGIVLRNDMTIQSLKRHKDDISEARNGFECGIKLNGFDDLKEGDMLEAYEMVEISRKLELEPVGK
ncbi:MAG: translation initiation factor IF-2 [Sedimentisphaerales bacterium]|nr:translation initiation factor IF-2 [Sedimentisphaerales bacterium]